MDQLNKHIFHRYVICICCIICLKLDLSKILPRIIFVSKIVLKANVNLTNVNYNEIPYHLSNAGRKCSLETKPFLPLMLHVTSQALMLHNLDASHRMKEHSTI